MSAAKKNARTTPARAAAPARAASHTHPQDHPHLHAHASAATHAHPHAHPHTHPHAPAPSPSSPSSPSEHRALSSLNVLYIGAGFVGACSAAVSADLLRGLAKRPLIMDGRRMLPHLYKDLQNSGFDIIAVGSPFQPAVKSK